jgi:YcxB-like protein
MSESVPMTPISFTLNKELVVKAAALAASRYYIRFLLFALIVGMLTSAFFIVSGSRANLERELLAASLTIMGALTVALLMIGLMRYVIYPLHARRNFRQQKALAEEMNLSWTDEVFIYTSGKSRSEMPFSNLHGYRTSSEIIILYLADTVYHMVPVDAFADTKTLDSFMHKLQQAGVKQL